MRKIFLLFSLALAMACCGQKLTEKVEASFPNGQPQYVSMVNKSGECVRWIEYYESGQVKMEGGMKDGKREGEWKAHFPDGRMQSIGIFENDQRTGAATVWQENGNLLQEGFYKNGTHCGKWKYYDEQGYVIKEVDYGE